MMPRRRQRAAHRGDIFAVEPEAVGQDEPAFDPARFVAKAIVVVDAADPCAPQFAVMHPAHEGGVLARHGLLIAIAVERPGLDLRFAQLAAVQKLMERMLVVIALRPDRADRGLERVRGQEFVRGRPQRLYFVHRVSSVPSWGRRQCAALDFVSLPFRPRLIAADTTRRQCEMN